LYELTKKYSILQVSGSKYSCAHKHYALTKASATEDWKVFTLKQVENIELHKNENRFADTWKACKVPKYPQGNMVVRCYYICYIEQGCAAFV